MDRQFQGMVTFPPELVAALAQEVLRLMPPAPASPEFLDVKKAAELMCCKPQRIYDLLSQGRLTRCRDGGRVLLERAEIVAYLHGKATGPYAREGLDFKHAA